jgi:hypothetical protein
MRTLGLAGLEKGNFHCKTDCNTDPFRPLRSLKEQQPLQPLISLLNPFIVPPLHPLARFIVLCDSRPRLPESGYKPTLQNRFRDVETVTGFTTLLTAVPRPVLHPGSFTGLVASVRNHCEPPLPVIRCQTLPKAITSLDPRALPVLSLEPSSNPRRETRHVNSIHCYRYSTTTILLSSSAGFWPTSHVLRVHR